MSESLGPDINIGGSALVVMWTLAGTAVIIAATRCWTQYKVTHRLGLSDALVILSVCTIVSFASLASVQYHFGWGRHYAYLTPHEQYEAIRFNWIGQPFGVMGSTWGRLSFIILMLQLFGTTKWQRRGLWLLFWAQLIPNSVVVVTLYIQCPRLDALWDFSIKVKCWPAEVQTYIGYAHTGWNGATDLFLTCLPATMLWNLQMNKRLKAGLGVLLGLSFFAFIAVIMKIIKLRALSEKGDYTFNTVSLFTWVTIESTLVVIAASVPLLRPLFTRFHFLPTSQFKPSHYGLNKYGPSPTSPSLEYDTGSSIGSSHHFWNFGSKKNKMVAKEMSAGAGHMSEEGISHMQRIEGGSKVRKGHVVEGGIVKETTFSLRVRSLEEEEKGMRLGLGLGNRSGNTSPISWGLVNTR